MNEAKLPLPLQYNTLFFLLEPLWYESCPDCVPLAGTRTPTHTVFDHVYATASMTNWTLEGDEPSGFFVEVDIAGIQKFISAARKVRDLWAGSWLVSALTWYTIADAVKILGADIVLSPFIAGNHYFIATLLAELREHAGEDAARKLITRIESIAAKAFLWTGAASQPIAPGTYFLALPCLPDELADGILLELERLKTVDRDSAKNLIESLRACDAEGVERYFRSRLRRAWQAITDAILNEEVLGVSGPRGLAERLSRAGVLAGSANEKRAAKYLEAAAREPPLHLRVVVVDVRESYEALVEKLRRELKGDAGDIARTLGTDRGFEDVLHDIASKLLFTYLSSIARSVKESEKRVKTVSVEPGYSIAEVLEEFTTESFRECTVCSKLPAVIHIRDQDSLRRLSKELGGLPRSLFTRGELLCPYCLYKRLLSIGSALVSVFDALKLYVAPKALAKISSRPPSTCELAALNAVLGVVDRLVDARREGDTEQLEAIRKHLNLGASTLESYGLHDAIIAYIEWRCGSNGECIKDMIELLQGLEAEYDFSCLLISTRGLRGDRLKRRCVEFYCGPKGKHCSDYERMLYTSFCDDARQLLQEASGRASAYYVVVRGDGDSFGKRLVRGILEYRDTAEYIEELANSIQDPKAARTLAGEYGGLASKLTRLAGKLGLGARPTVLVTPA